MYSFEEMRAYLYSAVVCDALDSLGFRDQSPRVNWGLQISAGREEATPLVGRCKTTLWADMYHIDPKPYELELQAVDACQPNDLLIAAAGGSMRSGIWGELLTTAARNQGCVGAIIDGAVRDVTKIAELDFSVLARGKCIYDSLNRQRVIDVDVPVEIEGVLFCPGDLVIADADGVVVIPQAVEQEALQRAFNKVQGENAVRDSIRAGMTAIQAFEKYGIL